MLTTIADFWIDTLLPQPWVCQECPSFVVGGETSLCSFGEWVVANPYTCSLGRWSSLLSSAELEPSSRSTWGLCGGCLSTSPSSGSTTSRTLAAVSSSTSCLSNLRKLWLNLHLQSLYFIDLYCTFSSIKQRVQVPRSTLLLGGSGRFRQGEML